VAFTYTGTASGTLSCSPVSVSTLAGVTTATCTSNTLSIAGTYTNHGCLYHGGLEFHIKYRVKGKTIGLASTTTTVVPSPSPSSVDQPVLFTATVALHMPALRTQPATVSFSYTLGAGLPVSLCSNIAVSTTAGVTTAVCTQPLPMIGSYTITAAYSGDTNFSPGSGTTPQTVNKQVPTITLTPSPASSHVNQTQTFSALVLAPQGAGAATQPSGTVTFTQGATTLCSGVAIVAPAQTATCSYAFTSATAGVTVTATYTGDTNFTAGTPGTTTETVTVTSTTTALLSLPSPSHINEQVAFTATVTPAYTLGVPRPNPPVR